jgi:hypothetical protein
MNEQFCGRPSWAPCTVSIGVEPMVDNPAWLTQTAASRKRNRLEPPYTGPVSTVVWRGSAGVRRFREGDSPDQMIALSNRLPLYGKSIKYS